MQERMRLIKEKMILSKNDETGVKARAEFIQMTKYTVDLLDKTAKCCEDVINFPTQGYGELAILCDIYGSDKGSLTDDSKQHPYAPLPAHTYTDIYEILFNEDDRKNRVKNIFECGIGTNNTAIPGNMTVHGKPGASLRVWRDFFQNAVIWGADIDRGILFEEERIKTGYMDQTNPESIKEFFDQAGVEEFDIIIDDGLHTFDAAKCLFDNIVGGGIGRLSKNGLYIIEDLLIDEIKQFYLHIRHDKRFIVKYLIMDTPYQWGNNLIIIQKNVLK
jgi:hypothetical protein